ncbi:MAG: tripartite tricarboxylate transporter substrate binding protein [Xenophilus sp.]
MNIQPRRGILAGTVAMALGAAASCAHAQAAASTNWPDRAIRFVVPVGAGGNMDNVARVLAEKMHHELGQPIIVENKPGASNIIGGDFVAKSPPDGYNVLVTGVGGRAILSALPDKIPYDPEKDLVPVGRAVKVPQVIVVPSRLKVSTLPEFVAYAKAQPRGVNLASLGMTSLTQVVAELFKRDTGIPMVSIPYRSGPAGVMAMLAGDADFMVADAAVVMPSVLARKLVALAVPGAQRVPELPDVPTTAEAGYPHAVVESSYGLYVPTGTPREVILRLNRAMRNALDQPDVRRTLTQTYVVPAPNSPEEFEAQLARTTTQLRPIARELGFSLK